MIALDDFSIQERKNIKNHVQHEFPIKKHHICYDMREMRKLLYRSNRNKVTVHKEKIKHEKYRHLHVSEHLNLCNGENFKICPMYNCYNSTSFLGESKEKEINYFYSETRSEHLEHKKIFSL